MPPSPGGVVESQPSGPGESDVFLLSGSEDLVPVLDGQLRRLIDSDTHPGWVVHRYRPRIEGLFARIERWVRASDQDTLLTLTAPTGAVELSLSSKALDDIWLGVTWSATA